MISWKIIGKKQIPHERGDGYYLILVVERDGKKREAIVSGATWYSAVIGSDVELTSPV